MVSGGVIYLSDLLFMHALDRIVLPTMKNFVSGVFTCPSKKAALLLCTVRVTVVLVSAIVFVTIKTAFNRKKK